MIINVRLADGRTTFQFASRKDFNRVLGSQPDHDEQGVTAWAKWSVEDPVWTRIRLRYVRKGSVSFVVDARDMGDGDHDLPARELQAERAERYRERSLTDVTAATAGGHGHLEVSNAV